MKIRLNLVQRELTDIEYNISKFPDGQQQVSINYNSWAITTSNGVAKVEIVSRLNNFLDLELIICSVYSLRNLGQMYIELYVPFFLGSRSDRLFDVHDYTQSNHYLKQVICPIVNSLKLNSVTVVDPHSTVLEGCLNDFKKITNFDLVQWAVSDIQKEDNKPVILLAPDAGAHTKIFNLSERLNNLDVIECAKKRDGTGKLYNTYVPIDSEDSIPANMVIVDDICDGGRTFNNIVEAIPAKKKSVSDVYLIVTHGIFSAGYDELAKNFKRVYCTNSYKDVKDNTLIKQVNIF